MDRLGAVMGYKPKSKGEIARNMSAIRSSENKTETALRKALHGAGLRYRKYCTDVPGRPDIVFRRAMVAVFVDGDFWHCRILVDAGLSALESKLRTPTRPYWLSKFQRRVERDREITKLLRAQGWLVLRLWESDVKRDIGRASRKVAAVVKRRFLTK